MSVGMRLPAGAPAAWLAVVVIALLALAVAGCAAQSGELSERRSNCFGELKAGPQSSELVAVPRS